MYKTLALYSPAFPKLNVRILQIVWEHERLHTCIRKHLKMWRVDFLSYLSRLRKYLYWCTHISVNIKSIQHVSVIHDWFLYTYSSWKNEGKSNDFLLLVKIAVIWINTNIFNTLNGTLTFLLYACAYMPYASQKNYQYLLRYNLLWYWFIKFRSWFCDQVDKELFSLKEMPSVDVCPKNVKDLMTASTSLGCGDDVYGNNQYLCLPNENKTSLVEFCYDSLMGMIEKGILTYIIQWFIPCQFRIILCL